MSIGICIPTYNRSKHLLDCLNSLSLQSDLNFEVCISDNGSDENISELIAPYKDKLDIKFSRNEKNLGAALNFLKVASMASKNFIWFLGDDDLLVPDAIKEVSSLIKSNQDCDFFWVNSYHLDADYINKFDSPFDTKNLPYEMDKLSKNKISKKLMFFDLIKHNIAFDYLLGVFVCVFKRDLWEKNTGIVNQELIKDKRSWSNFENTCFHIKIFCEAFTNSKSYFLSKPQSVNLYGVREWGDIYPLVEIIRIPEALDYYRSKGMNFFQYIYEKNYALRNFFNYFIKIYINGEKMGTNYINIKKHFFYNLIYPNAWLSIIYFSIRQIKKLFRIKR